MAERWRPVLGFEGLYEVSDHGRISALPGPRRRQRSILVATVDERGYPAVSLSNRRTKHKRVHVAVAEAFLGLRPEGYVTRHLDGDPTNNLLSNLRWGTTAENTADTIGHGRHNHADKTRCKAGHPFDAANTFIRKYDGSRVCRTCKRSHNRASYAKVGKRRSGGTATPAGGTS